MKDEIDWRDLPKYIVREIFITGMAAGFLIVGVLLFVVLWLVNK